MAEQYDAFLLVSFGGPEKPEDVMPFLENVVRGKNVPRERLEEVAHHYDMFGGKSPINDQCRKLIEALRAELDTRGPRLPIYWGNRNWHPFLADTLRQMEKAGVRRALAFATSAYGSYSGCRQYLEDIERARADVGSSIVIDKIRAFHDHPGFIEPMAERVADARGLAGEGARVVYTAHSVPTAMAETGPYVEQLEETCRLVSERAGVGDHDLVWQSRSGPPQVPWLEPDILDHLRALREAGTEEVVVVPIGFISDHMEVLYDLDVEAKQLCDEIGLRLHRAATVGAHPRFVSMIRELVRERTDDEPALSIGTLGPAPDRCAPDCCNYVPRRPGRH